MENHRKVWKHQKGLWGDEVEIDKTLAGVGVSSPMVQNRGALRAIKNSRIKCFSHTEELEGVESSLNMRFHVIDLLTTNPPVRSTTRRPSSWCVLTRWQDTAIRLPRPSLVSAETKTFYHPPRCAKRENVYAIFITFSFIHSSHEGMRKRVLRRGTCRY